MLAYCTALRVGTGWLVYADGAPGPDRRRVRHSPIEIVPYPLDLTATPEEILRQVAVLAAQAMNAGRIRSCS